MSCLLPIAGYFFYRIGFREIKINKSWWMVVKVPYVKSKVLIKKSGNVRSYSFEIKAKGVKKSFEIRKEYFSFFPWEKFQKEVKEGDLLYLTVLKKSQKKKTILLGGVKTKERVYFNFKSMRKGIEKNKKVARTFFWGLFVMSLLSWGVTTLLFL